jgi:periplasmic divalent cation tolerance protein
MEGFVHGELKSHTMAPPSAADTVAEIRTTFAARDAAEACANRLVAERLAACVQIDGPVHSTYRWQDAVESAAEWRCTCKTTPARAAACVAAIVAQHPYTTPEVLVRESMATPAYAAWVRESVAAF